MLQPKRVGLSELSRLTGYSRMHLYRMGCRSRDLWAEYRKLYGNDAAQAALLRERGSDMQMPSPEQAGNGSQRRLSWRACPNLDKWIAKARRRHGKTDLRFRRTSRNGKRKPAVFVWDRARDLAAWINEKRAAGSPLVYRPELIEALLILGRIGAELQDSAPAATELKTGAA